MIHERQSKKLPTPRLGARFERALTFGFEVHCTQTRKGGNIPYIGHLLGVCSIVIEAGGDEDQVIAALLHDAVEDQGGLKMAQKIEVRFGPEVRRIVEECSDHAPEGAERSTENWRERKEQYIDHLQKADSRVRLVSLADKLYNARTILADLEQHGSDVWTRFSRPRADQIWYYRSLTNVFKQTMGAGKYRWLTQELELTVDALEAWKSPPNWGTRLLQTLIPR